jgi:hypothetical protein
LIGGQPVHRTHIGCTWQVDGLNGKRPPNPPRAATGSRGHPHMGSDTDYKTRPRLRPRRKGIVADDHTERPGGQCPIAKAELHHVVEDTLFRRSGAHAGLNRGLRSGEQGGHRRGRHVGAERFDDRGGARRRPRCRAAPSPARRRVSPQHECPAVPLSRRPSTRGNSITQTGSELSCGIRLTFGDRN